MLQERDRRIAETLRGSLEKRSIPLVELVVFGSRARGDASEESDMDVLVVVESVTETIRRNVVDCAWEAGFAEGIVVVPIVITQEELENSPEAQSDFIRSVHEDGVRV